MTLLSKHKIIVKSQLKDSCKDFYSINPNSHDWSADPMFTRVMSAKEVAQALGISMGQVYDLLRIGAIGSFKEKNMYNIPKFCLYRYAFCLLFSDDYVDQQLAACALMITFSDAQKLICDQKLPSSLVTTSDYNVHVGLNVGDLREYKREIRKAA